MPTLLRNRISGTSAMPREFHWATWPDEQILKVRFKDLGVSIAGTWLEGCLKDLHDELENRDLQVRPHAWISEEWFSPNNTYGISIPFYLSHPRLRRLERRQMLEVEGGTVGDCRRILRHEAGHVIQHAFRLHRRRRWQQLFGRSSTRYPKYYRPDPISRNYVQHLRLWYAQAHPDEDFAETFAVWLRPRSDWRARYADWPALAKLKYVDELMGEIAGVKPMPAPRQEVDPISRLSTTLADHYRNKQALYAVQAPTIYDRDLRRIFTDDPKDRIAPTATRFLRRNSAKIRRQVARWTGEHQLTLDSMLDEMIARCNELRLRAVGPEEHLRNDFTVLFTAVSIRVLYGTRRRRWFAL
jgi:hypothetical protein